MTDETRKSLWGQLRTTFLRGVGFIIPLGLTYWFFKALLNAVDGILSPLLEQWIGQHLPGLGFLSMIVIIFVVGVLSRNLVGRLTFAWFENLLRSIPLVRSVYSAIKDLVGAFILEDKSKTFRQVVMMEYPRAGLYCLGFVTNEMPFDTFDGHTIDFVNVYIPNPPNPTSGFLLLVPRRQAVPLDLTIEQGLKLVLSGGIVLPHQRLRARRAYY
ncbi:MAG: DUF502 domain-containing protein [Bacteroidota bacterium]